MRGRALAEERERKKRSIPIERAGRGWKARMNLLHRELHVHIVQDHGREGRWERRRMIRKRTGKTG